SDPALCQEVRRYLARYMRNWAVTEASVEAAATSGATRTVPNSYGLDTSSEWSASLQGFWQPSDHMLFSAGAVAYAGEVNPQGSVMSIGWDRAQLDIGYRAHWFSPAPGNSMLISTQAPTMPSVTLSNYVPLTRFGFTYELFAAEMSKSDHISFNGDEVSGNPRLAGIHLGFEPASGWALGLNRIEEYGGGPRPASLRDLFKAFFNPASFDNEHQFGNQAASLTSAFVFPGRVPFTVYVEHAGEDTSDLKPYLLGNAALSVGIHFPRLWRRFDLTYEVSEWQNAWYVHTVYLDGLSNKGHVIGHWGADDRVFRDGVGAQAHMVRIGYDAPFGGLLEMRLSTLQNEHYTEPSIGLRYERAYDALLRYTRPIGAFSVGAEAYAGRDSFGDSFSRIGAFFRYSGDAFSDASTYFAADPSGAADPSAELFVEAGISANKLTVVPTETIEFTERGTGAHIGLGARRTVSDRSDLGVRLELDDVEGHNLTSVRMIDYRYRFRSPLALSVFLGASRYDLATPAYGLYFGGGLQWRDILPGWDVGLDVRQAKKVARDHLLPSDPQVPRRNDSFYTVDSFSISLTRRF
ncbi:MAG TPA: capsule assembly Wzi family protein, partial [Steroidobacteraceae bacterium]|nr:capsule assembly Wzi family protein [Steroidobacteraceae bacterium]